MDVVAGPTRSVRDCARRLRDFVVEAAVNVLLDFAPQNRAVILVIAAEGIGMVLQSNGFHARRILVGCAAALLIAAAAPAAAQQPEQRR